MNIPKKNESWHIEYGVKNNRDIVKVLEPTIYNEKNWRKDMFTCQMSDGNIIDIQGHCFVKKSETRVFYNPSKPA